jgi:hypothetical protein
MAEIYVEGNLLLRSKHWDQNGEKRYRTEVVEQVATARYPKCV